MSDLDLAQVIFRKSSHSEGGNGCVEVAVLGARLLIRDSKNPARGFLSVGSADWGAFLAKVRSSSWDL